MEKTLCLIVLSLFRIRAESKIEVSSSLYAIEDKDFILTCTTTNVPISILWTRNGTSVAYMYMQSDTCGSADAGFGLYSNYRYNCTDNETYNLIMPGNRISQENGSKWQCRDTGEAVGSLIFTFKVASAPTSDPVLTGYSGMVLYPGNTTTLACTVQGGTPLATLSWTCGGSSIIGIVENSTTTSISEVTLNINSSYNGQKCVCKAKHLLWTTDKTAKSQRFVVY